MFIWNVEQVGEPNAKGEIPTKWYAYDEFDGEKLSPKAMQDGLTSEEVMSLWQRKHWSLLKEKYLAKELMTFDEAKQLKCYEDLKAWVEGKNAAAKAVSIKVEPEKQDPLVQMSSEAEATAASVRAHLNEPIDMSKVNVPKKSSKTTGNNSKFAEKVATATANALEK